MAWTVKSTAEKEAEKAKQKEEMINAKLSHYGIQDLIDSGDIDCAKNVLDELKGTGLMELGTMLTFNGDASKVEMEYQKAMIEQNFIIIRQLARISNQLEELNKK